MVKRQTEEPEVMISLEGDHGIEETLYLFRSHRNAQRLLEALQQAEKKEFIKKDLIEV
jgi:antitoxin YefM